MAPAPLAIGHRPARRRDRLAAQLGLAAILALACATGAAPQAVGPRGAVAVALPPLAISDLLLRSAFAAIDRNDIAGAERLVSTALAAASVDDPYTRGEAFRCRGLIALAGGRHAEASSALAEAESLFEAAGATLHLALTWRHRALVAVEQGQRPLARELAERALAVFEARHADEEVVATLSVLESVLDRSNGGEQAMARALELAERTGQRRQRANLLHTRGDRRFGEGDFAGAVRSYEQAEAVYESLGDDEGLGRVWTSLGRLNRAHGRHAAALDYYRRAHAALERAGDRPGVIQAVNATATALGNLGRTDEARAAYERALALAEQLGTTRIVNFQRGNLGGRLLATRDFSHAVPLLRESAAQEPNPTTRAIRLSQLGQALAGEGRHQQAVAAFDEAIALLQGLLYRERLFGALAARADAYRALGRRDEALADVRASLEVLEEVRRQLAPGDFLRRGFHRS